MNAKYTLCEVAQKNSRWVWRRLEQFFDNEVAAHEESITDFFVLNFRRWAPAGFEIKTFTHREESRTGGDWEWWFGSAGGGWLGMNVQAKIIKQRAHEYDQLHYNRGRQTKTLIDVAAAKMLIPLYCLYTYWDRDYRQIHNFKPARRTGEWGVSILSAEVVDKTRRKSLSDLITSMIPLEQLFCFDRRLHRGFADTVLENAARLNLVGNRNGQSFQRLLTPEPPSYVRHRLEAERNRDGVVPEVLGPRRITIIYEVTNEAK